MEGVIGRFAGSSRAILGNELGISEQKNLEGISVEIQAAFNKAEKMQTTLVQHRWVSDVKDTAYDLEILFEEIQLKEVASTLRLLSSVQLNIDGKLHLFSRFPPGRPSSRDMISMVIERLENLRQGIKSLNIASCLGQGKDSSSFPQSIRNRIITARNNHSTSRPIPIENQSRIGGNSRGFKEIASLTEALTLSEPTYSALPWYLKQCLNFCILYPTGFCFDKDLLVLLWIAEGFVQPVFVKRLEDVGADYFDALLSWSFFQVSYPGSKCQDPTYKLCEGYDQTIRCFMSSDNEFVQIKFSDQVVSEKTRHASGIYHTTLHAFSSLIGLRSLLLLSNNPDRVKNVPFYFFLKLKYLRVLVLSGACIKEVPRPVWDLVHLRYLDLSYNKVKILPEDLANPYRLQTIRLIDCPISMFPQNFHELVNLRHIHIDLMACLTVLPPHIGRLTSLQTLPFFIVKRESGCRIDELKELNDLRGELFIKNLENVVSLEEAEEAKLYAKQHLRSLKLKWGSRNLNVNYDVINGLQPHKNLSVLHIVYYRGSEFPYWISDPSFTNLVSITLTECKNWKLPPLLVGCLAWSLWSYLIWSVSKILGTSFMDMAQ